MSEELKLAMEFRAELEKTCVISDSFKEWLQACINEASRVAYKHGYGDGIKEERESHKRREKSSS